MRFFKRDSGNAGEGTAGRSGSVLTSAELARFMDLVRAWLRANTREFREVDGGGIDAILPDGQKLQIGLVNLMQKCGRADEKEWPDLIRGHLGSLIAAQGELELSFENASSMIKVRLFPEHLGLPTDGDPRKQPLSDVVAPGIRRILALDLPTTVRTVSLDQVERWGQTAHAMWDLALENIRAQDIPDLTRIANGAATLLSGESFFIASWALMLERYLDPVPERGALVIVPNRHTLAFVPTVDGSFLTTLGPFVQLAQTQFQQGPGSISPNLYWWRPSGLTLLPTEIKDRQLAFTPPDEFNAMVMTLK